MTKLRPGPQEVRINNLAPRVPFYRGEWKFVIVDTAAARHLVLGPISQFRYHAGLVRSFCESHEIACLTVKKPDLVEVVDRRASVRGGGRMRCDRATGTLAFYGSSQAYGVFSEPELRDILDRTGQFASFTLQVTAS